MKITDEAVEAGAAALERMYKGPGEDPFYSMAKNVLEAALPHLSQGAVRVRPLEWKIASDRHEHAHSVLGSYFAYDDGSWSNLASHHMRRDGDIGSAKAAAQADYELRILSALSPAPVGVTGSLQPVEVTPMLKGRRASPAYFPATGETCEVSGPNCDDDNGYTWEKTTVLWQDNLFVLYGREGFWPNLNKREHVLFRPIDALAPHEPAPTDTQEGASVAGEVVAWRNWNQLHECYYLDEVPRGILKVHDEKNEPLVRQSALTACQQEVETLREGIKEIAEREQSIRDNWVRYEESTKARILELETDLEVANDKLRVANEALEPFAIVAEHDIGEGESDDDIFWPISNARYSMAGRLRVGHLRRARAALGGQSNEA